MGLLSVIADIEHTAFLSSAEVRLPAGLGRACLSPRAGSCFWCHSADGCVVVLAACPSIRNVTLHKYVIRSVARDWCSFVMNLRASVSDSLFEMLCRDR